MLFNVCIYVACLIKFSFFQILDERNLTISEEINKIPDECYKLISDYEKLIYRSPPSLEMYQGLIGECKVLYPSYEYASVEFLKGLWIYNGTLDGIVLENSWPLDQSNKTINETAQYLPYFSPVIKNRKIFNGPNQL